MAENHKIQMKNIENKQRDKGNEATKRLQCQKNIWMAKTHKDFDRFYGARNRQVRPKQSQNRNTNIYTEHQSLIL